MVIRRRPAIIARDKIEARRGAYLLRVCATMRTAGGIDSICGALECNQDPYRKAAPMAANKMDAVRSRAGDAPEHGTRPNLMAPVCLGYDNTATFHDDAQLESPT